jgi:hypothetical protein
MLPTNLGARRIWLVLLALAAITAILVQSPVHAAPRWTDSSEKPGNNKGGKKQVNEAPVISGSPPGEALVAQIYRFVPTASDADDDALSFSIKNKPGWANFDTTSGTLSGVPTDADVRIYDNIYISVSDGTAIASTDSFSIAVVNTTLGAATISWLAPDQNADGSALLDLSGYRIYYGNLSGQYSRQLEINSASIMTAVIDDLSQGTWYFAATALTSQGLESAFSDEVMMLVP